MSHNDPQPTDSGDQAPRFTCEEERDLALKAQQGDMDAREQLVLSNVPGQGGVPGSFRRRWGWTWMSANPSPWWPS